ERSRACLPVGRLTRVIEPGSAPAYLRAFALRGSKPQCGTRAVEARIARNEGRNSERTARVAGVDQVVLVEEVLNVSGDFPAAVARVESGAQVHQCVSILEQRAARGRVVVVEVVLGFVLINRCGEKTTGLDGQRERGSERDGMLRGQPKGIAGIRLGAAVVVGIIEGGV